MVALRFTAAFLLCSSSAAAFAQAPSIQHARTLFDARNYDAARAEFAALARSSPSDATPVLYLGRIALAENDNEGGIKQFERCVEINERNVECHAWLGNALGMAAQHTSKFKLPFLAKRTKREFDRAVELDPNNIDGRMGELQYYLFAPGFAGGSIDKAREQAAEIEKFNKLRGAIAFGMIADHDKNAHDSQVAYERAIAASPDSAAGYFGLVNAYARDEKWAEAFQVVDRFQARRPGDPAGFAVLARLAVMSGQQLARGEGAAKHWLANPPPDVSPNAVAAGHVRLGAIYEKSGRRELAKGEYEHAVAINPKSDEAKRALDGVR